MPQFMFTRTIVINADDEEQAKLRLRIRMESKQLSDVENWSCDKVEEEDARKNIHTR